MYGTFIDRWQLLINSFSGSNLKKMYFWVELPPFQNDYPVSKYGHQQLTRHHQILQSTVEVLTALVI